MGVLKWLLVILVIALIVLFAMRKQISNFVGSTFVIQTFPIGDQLGWCGTAFPNNFFKVLLGVDKYAPVGMQYTPYYLCEVRVPAKVDQKAPIDWMSTSKFCAPNFKPSEMASHYNPGKWAPNVGAFFLNFLKSAHQVTTTYYGIVPAAWQATINGVMNPVVYASNATTAGIGYAQSSGAEQSLNNMVDAISQTEGDSYSYYYRCDPVAPSASASAKK
jgi:hypothetical protein